VQVTYERMRHVLKDMCRHDGQLRGIRLLEVAFSGRPPTFSRTVPKWKNLSGKQLDATQKAAVDLVLTSQDIALIHGPPGASLHA
jgi:hypothetical protein